jgi:hypothetical protein
VWTCDEHGNCQDTLLYDGVILNHDPLWRMIGLPKWRKDCQATWEKLAAGDYD